VIVISGVLLLVAVVFLVIGLLGPLGWVYASIVVSVLAFGFMMIALRQQRSSLAAEPVPPLHPVGTTGRTATGGTATADPKAANGDGEVTVLPPGAVSSQSPASGSAAAPDDAAPVAQPAVPLVPPTRKSAARKVASKPAEKTTAETTTAAGEVTPAKKAPVKRPAAKTTAAAEAGSDPESEAPVKKRAPRKTAAKKATPAMPPAPEDEQPAEPVES
jgi:hypothetical protein